MGCDDADDLFEIGAVPAARHSLHSEPPLGRWVGAVETASLESAPAEDAAAWGAEIDAAESAALPVQPVKRKVAPVLAKPVLANASLPSSSSTGMMGFGLRGSVEETAHAQVASGTTVTEVKAKPKTIRVSKN